LVGSGPEATDVAVVPRDVVVLPCGWVEVVDELDDVEELLVEVLDATVVVDDDVVVASFRFGPSKA
jgi:hypothetical protein